MTNEDKQIEEMAKDMCEYYYEGTCYQDKKPCDCKCDIFSDAQYLYAKGYRKASDVAREIFGELEATFNGDGFHYFIAEPIFDKLKKKYESEGEE